MTKHEPTADVIDRATRTPSQAELTVPPIPPTPVDARPATADDDQAARMAGAEAKQMVLDLMRWEGEGGALGDD